MQTTMSPIALKGFVLGYMSKNAEATLDDYEQVNQVGASDPTQFAKGVAESQGIHSGSDLRNTGAEDFNPVKDSAKSMAGMLKGVLPGMGIGAAALGGGSAAVDMAQDKPVNVRRALLIATLLGIPLGAATQMAGASAGYGKGPSLGDFGRGASRLAGGLVGAGKSGVDKAVSKGKQVAADVSGKASAAKKSAKKDVTGS